MFYLQTKDGEKFFTNKDSDDRLEFEKIIDSKLGRDSADLFNALVKDDEEKAEHILHEFAHRYKECLDAFDKVLNETPVDTVKLEEILCDLQSLYLDLM